MSTSQVSDEKDSIIFLTESEFRDPTLTKNTPNTTEGAITATGEINWDCPCLGGLPYGPCGDQFRAAFSCFVFSEQEPKGIDCVDKFQSMQDCFREHPDVYADELQDEQSLDDDEDDLSEIKDVAVSDQPYIAATPDNDAQAVFPVTDPTASSVVQ